MKPEAEVTAPVPIQSAPVQSVPAQSPPAQGAPRSSLLASFADYAEAQRLVDRMSDDGFPVESVRIIGDGVRTVEQVTGRMTRAKAAVSGAAGGAWFGVLIGLLFGLFTSGTAWAWMLLVSLAIGAFWGAVFGFAAHWTTRGKRDFSSVMTLEAQRYDVHVDASQASKAARYVQ